MKVYAVRGGGGLRLHVREWRKADGPSQSPGREHSDVATLPLPRVPRCSHTATLT